MKRVVNPLVLWILRSPLHRLLSSRLAAITVTGRRSGARHALPVGYRQVNGSVEIRVGAPERKLWWRNLQGDGAPVEILIRGEASRGPASLRRQGENLTVVVDLSAVAGDSAA